MLGKLSHVTVGDKEYPIAFNLNVMEALQEHFGSIDAWTNALKPEKDEPKFKDIILTFREFINEGIDIENEDKQEKRQFITDKQAGRIVSEFGINETSGLISTLSVKSVKTDNPNAQTTQNQTNQ
jgi:hypothetical protein